MFMNELFSSSLNKKTKKISREATQRNRQRNNQQIVHNRGVGVKSCFLLACEASWNQTKISTKTSFSKRRFQFIHFRKKKIFSSKSAKTEPRINYAMADFWDILKYFVVKTWTLLTITTLIASHVFRDTFITHSLMTPREEAWKIYRWWFKYGLWFPFGNNFLRCFEIFYWLLMAQRQHEVNWRKQIRFWDGKLK